MTVAINICRAFVQTEFGQRHLNAVVSTRRALTGCQFCFLFPRFDAACGGSTYRCARRLTAPAVDSIVDPRSKRREDPEQESICVGVSSSARVRFADGIAVRKAITDLLRQ
jgi:hypothetical protein